MELALAEPQRQLAESATAFLADAAPLDQVRQWAEAGGQLDRAYWSRVAEQGWLESKQPLADLVLIAEQRGRALQPGPLVSTRVATLALDVTPVDPARQDVAAAIARGDTAVAWAVGNGPLGWLPGDGVRIEATPRGWLATGVAPMVPDAASVDLFLVWAQLGHDVVQFVVPAGTPGLTLTPLERLDLTRSFADVAFESVAVPAELVIPATAKLLERQLQQALVLAVAETVGAMTRLLELAVTYAKHRVAFGRPIGSFQAIKHLLADTSVLLETSQAMAASAARAVQAGQSDASTIASMAKAFVGESAVSLAHACWQTFGGVAYTWQHDFHLYLRRLTTDAALYGDSMWHYEQICRLEGM
ncbi:MAG: acyl-CoA dehydrogenase protein [Acidimicrobiia bacterium]|nr:acyl-CoA dehydrogenase protein [Acidimicrobiia bacterium]